MAKKRTKSGQFAKRVARKTAKRGKRSSTKRASGRRRRSVTRAGFGNVTNLLALAGGAAVAWHYRDDGRLVKLLKEPKTRYLVMSAVGLGLGSGMVANRLKMPEPLRMALIGAGVANAVAAVPVLFPKLLPAPKPATNGIGRLTQEQMQRLQQYVEQQKRGTALVNGTQGRGSVITGRMPAAPVITGTQYHMRNRRNAGWR